MKLFVKNPKFLYLSVLSIIVLSLEVFTYFEIEIPKYVKIPEHYILNIFSLKISHFPCSPIIYGIFILTSGGEIVLKNGLKSLLKLHFSNISLLMLLIVLAAYYLEDYTEAAAVIILYTLGEKLEDIGIKTSLRTTERLVRNTPKAAFFKNSGKYIEVNAISKGSIIQVKPYEQIPLDGIIEKGETLVDESSITGESIWSFKKKGNFVFAGTWNKSGWIEILTTRKYKDSIFSRIITLARSPQKNKASVEKFIEKFAEIYTPIIIFLSLLTITISLLILHQNFSLCLHQAIQLLVISCPCAFVISTPIAVYAALGNASSKGILIKGGKFFEILAQVKVIGFNKTMIFTNDLPIISNIVPLNGTNKKELLIYGSVTKLFSEYPLSQVIIDAFKKEGLAPNKFNCFKNMIEKKGKVHCIVCNSTDKIKKTHLINNQIQEIISQFSSTGKTSILIHHKKKIKGILGLKNTIKSDSLETINTLYNFGIKIVILTEDRSTSAKGIAEKIFSGSFLYEKTEKIRELKYQYKYIAMVGDGIKDAQALAISSVGIIINATKNKMIVKIADIILMNDKLSLLPFLIRLSKKMVKTIKWNTFGAIIIKCIFVTLTLYGYGNLVLAILSDIGVTLIVTLISLRIRHTK